MEFLSGYSNLSPEAKLATIGETSGCIYHHNRRIHFGKESLGVRRAIRNDHLGVVG
jgi:hypothetical protein